MSQVFQIQERRLRIISLAFVVSALCTPTRAQPSLNVTRVLSSWPSIEIYFSAKCVDKPVKFTDKSYFKVLESGLERPFTLWCPGQSARLSISSVLLFDVSASMTGSGLTDLRAAGQAFVDRSIQGIDEIAVGVFSDTSTILQKWTRDKATVRSAIQGIVTAGGNRCLWDGLIATLQNLSTAGTANRSIVVLTNGIDSVSIGTLSRVIELANRNFFHIHVVQLGTSAGTAGFRMLADSTVGTFHHAQYGSELVQIFQEISDIETGGYDECVITFDSAVPDGSTRKIELQLQNFCNGTASDTGSYRAPLITAVDDLSRAARALSLEVYPDPVTSSAIVSITGAEDDCVRVHVLDASGRLVQDLGEPRRGSASSFTLSLAGQPAGVYYVVGMTPTTTRIQRLVKL